MSKEKSTGYTPWRILAPRLPSKIPRSAWVTERDRQSSEFSPDFETKVSWRAWLIIKAGWVIASHRIVCQRCVYRLWKKLTRRSCNKIVGLTSLVKKTMKNKVVIVLPWKSFLMILSLTKQLSPSPLAPRQALRFLYRSERETRIRPFPLFSLISWKPLRPRHRLLRRCFFRAEVSAKREWQFTDFVYFISWPCARSRDHTCALRHKVRPQKLHLVKMSYLSRRREILQNNHILKQPLDPGLKLEKYNTVKPCD